MALTSTEEALVRQLLDQQAAILSLAGNESTITSKLGATKVTLSDLLAASAVGDTDLFLTRQGTTDKSVTAAVLRSQLNLFLQSGTGAVERTIESRLRETISVKDFGAVGNGVADDTVAISSAITEALSGTYARNIFFPAGRYKVTSALPIIDKSILVMGENPRSSQIAPSGNFDCLTFKGTASRVADSGVVDCGIYANGMTGGFAVVVDWAQNTTFENFIIADAQNCISLRQCGNTSFRNTLLDNVMGDYGVYAYASNTLRNGENDQIDIISFYDSVFQGNYTPGGPVPTAELLYLDGRVHTLGFFGLRLLSSLRGLVCKNSPALAQNFVPRFFMGSDLEVENMYAETQRLDYAVDYFVDSIFGAGSYTADGIYLGIGVGNFNPGSGSVNSNSLCGVNIDGAVGVNINELSVYNNSLVGSGVKSGIYIASASKDIAIRGGLAGKAYWLPSYTENQKYGIEINSTDLVQIDNVNTRGNATGSIYPGGATIVGSYVKSCPGFNPTGASLRTVGASPYSYTAGLAQEAVTLYGGTGVVVTVDGIALTNTTPASFVLAPRKTAVISYDTAPTMAINGM